MEKGYTPEMPDTTPKLPDGATIEPIEGKTYKTLELPKGTLAINFNEYELPNGVLIEVDKNGLPIDKFTRKWIKSDVFKGKLI